MSDPNTLRVLSLWGGGTRGYLQVKFLELFADRWGVPRNELWKNFDVIAGTSVGGILAAGIGLGMDLSELEPFFLRDAPWIFTERSPEDLFSNDASEPNNRPSSTEKLFYIATAEPFYKAASPDSNYGDAKLKSVISSVVGNKTMQDLKTNTLITSVSSDGQLPAIFTNKFYLGFEGQNELLLNVLMATSAAPFYFPPWQIGTEKFFDGGIYQNNPASLGVTYAMMLKPTANTVCVLSLGSGLGNLFYDIGVPNEEERGLFDYATKSALRLVNSLMAGSGNAIDNIFALRSRYTLERIYPLHFQPALGENRNIDLDNADPEFMTFLAQTATEWYNDPQNLDKIDLFIKRLDA
jgi:uncharacterized protein